jgi:hypothetical protein
MPPLLAVREFLARHAGARGLGYFDAEVEAALIDAEQSGDFRELREAIAGGLWKAICGEHFEEVVRLGAAERGRVLRERMSEWLFTHRPPSFKEYMRVQAAKDPEPMRGFLMPAEDEQPRPWRWEFMEEAPPGFPQGGDDRDDPDGGVPAAI